MIGSVKGTKDVRGFTKLSKRRYNCPIKERAFKYYSGYHAVIKEGPWVASNGRCCKYLEPLFL